MKERLDVLLVQRGHAASREKAKAVIMAGCVYVNGQKEDKAGSMFDCAAEIEVRGNTLRYVSRGGLKLEKAMKNFGVELKVINEQGQEAAKLQASDVLFGREFNEALVHQIVVAYQANARSGDSKQKDRSEVRHTTTKPWRQKGTGRARAGSNGSPLWRGGGRIFPNSPDQNYSQKVNKTLHDG
jgi:ribosomal protein S4